MTRFSFLHAADIHLDSPLRGLSRYDGVPADEVRTATREALDNLVRTAIRLEVAFVVIAGDLFDGAPKDVGAAHSVAAGFGELGRAGIPVYLLTGNHDAESAVIGALPPMDHVHWFPTRKPATFTIDHLGVALHGQGFAQRDGRNVRPAAYPERHDRRFNLGVLHTSLGGYADHEPYAPCSLEDLLAKRYDYWALGHVHTHDVVHLDPPVVFSGNLQGRNIREDGPKGAVLVEVEDARVERLTHLPLDVVRWATIPVDVATGAAPANNMAELQTLLRTAIETAAATEAGNRPLLARIVFTGDTPLHGAIQDWALSSRDEIRLIAAGVSRHLWIEKIQVRTKAPAATMALEAADDLAGLLDAPDEDLLARLQAEFTVFLAKQPAADPDSLLLAARTNDWTPIIAQAAAALRARMNDAG